MAMRTRYDVLRYSRTTWVICACVLLQKYNQQRNQNRIVHCPHQSKSQSRNPTSRNRWSERSFSWPPSPGRLNNQEPPKGKMSKRQATDYQERLVQEPPKELKREEMGSEAHPASPAAGYRRRQILRRGGTGRGEWRARWVGSGAGSAAARRARSRGGRATCRCR